LEGRTKLFDGEGKVSHSSAWQGNGKSTKKKNKRNEAGGWLPGFKFRGKPPELKGRPKRKRTRGSRRRKKR